MALSAADPIVRELVAAGIIPPNCYQWRLIADVADVVRIEAAVYVTVDDMRVIADVLKRHPESIVMRERAKVAETGEQTPLVDVTALGDKWRRKEIRMACEPVVFKDVTPARWDEIEKSLVGRGLDISAQMQAADAGSVVIGQSDIVWSYDTETQTLTVQCVKKPHAWIPCGAINDRIKEAFNDGK